jgi:hypothetical protein
VLPDRAGSGTGELFAVPVQVKALAASGLRAACSAGNSKFEVLSRAGPVPGLAENRSTDGEKKTGMLCGRAGLDLVLANSSPGRSGEDAGRPVKMRAILFGKNC